MSKLACPHLYIYWMYKIKGQTNQGIEKQNLAENMCQRNINHMHNIKIWDSGIFSVLWLWQDSKYSCKTKIFCIKFFKTYLLWPKDFLLIRGFLLLLGRGFRCSTLSRYIFAFFWYREQMQNFLSWGVLLLC